MRKLWAVAAIALSGCGLYFDDPPEPDAAPAEVDALAAPDAVPDAQPDAVPSCACGFENAVCDHLNQDTGAHFVCICRDGAWDCNGLPVPIVACVPVEDWTCTEIAFTCDYDGC